jgi:hypothetical protein
MSSGLKINHVTEESTPNTYIEYRAVLSKWDVFIAGWGSGGGVSRFGRYETFVQAQAALIVAQHEYDYHRPGV